MRQRVGPVPGKRPPLRPGLCCGHGPWARTCVSHRPDSHGGPWRAV